jgi:hypothetical protein
MPSALLIESKKASRSYSSTARGERSAERLAGLARPAGAIHPARARLFICEAFAQQPIHHQLGVDLKLGWCGLHDCAGPPSLFPRNLPENFSRVWWVAEVAADRGDMRHDLFPKQVNYSKARSKGAMGAGGLAIGSKDIVLEYMIPSLMEH